MFVLNTLWELLRVKIVIIFVREVMTLPSGEIVMCRTHTESHRMYNSFLGSGNNETAILITGILSGVIVNNAFKIERLKRKTHVYKKVACGLENRFLYRL